jgi:tetratricopeptide (TPR) repeat protein/CHAT domain-containing protein
MSLNDLASAFLTRFQQLGAIADLHKAIDLYRNALELRPIGHSLRPSSLNDLASAVLTRFQQLGEMADLREAIDLYRNALALCPPGHPDRSMSLNNLASAILTRFQQLGAIADLHEAIDFHRNALELRPIGHPLRPSSLNNLANVVLTRFQQLGAIADLHEAIDLYRNAHEFCPIGHPDRSMSLNNLASAVLTRFRQLGKIPDLHEAIDLYRNALELRPIGHPLRSWSLHNLAGAVLTQFQQLGAIGDLHEAIDLHRSALELRPIGHPLRSMSLNSLASAVSKQFQQLGTIADLHEAIDLYRNTLELRPIGHPDRSMSLNNLANMVLRRFQQLGAIADLHEAIDLHRNALELRPIGHPLRSMSLNNLSGAVLIRFRQLGEIPDLHEAIELYRNALELRPIGHPDRSDSLSSLASAVSTQFQQLGAIADLHEAVDLNRKALELRTNGHPLRSMSLNNFASLFLTGFERTGDTSHLAEASKLLSDAENSSPVYSPELGRTWTLLAHYHIHQYQIDSDSSTDRIPIAFAYFRRAAEYDSASVKERLSTTLHWAAAARERAHESLLHAYSTALELLNRYVVASPSVERQLKMLSMSVDIPPSLALDAAASAIEAGKLETAVEFLEQGRTLLWAQVRRFRHPIEELRGANSELAVEFEAISRRLELLALSGENAPVMDSGDDPRIVTRDRVIPRGAGSSFRQIPEVYDAQLREQRKLSEQWNAVVEKIRCIDGFSNFLKAVPFTTLQSAAADGPVVVVNISKYRSDAIIIRESLDPILVPLPPRATPKILQRLFTKFRQAHSQSRDNKYFSNELCTYLGILWELVVEPIVDELIKIGVKKGSRIWWCPTSYLCGIPLHAAGPFVPYGKSHSVPDHMWLPDLYVSSYTSTLSVLTSARSNVVSRINAPSLLVVAETSSLKYVDAEIQRINKSDRKVETMIGEEATREAVLRRLPDHPYVHFACHGSSPNSFHSAFVLWNNDRLELIELIKAKLPNAQHAFISSCHGADTDTQVNPDEIISLAAALQFCGYRGVVGTLWEMKDADGPSIAGHFYDCMFSHDVDGQVDVDVKDSARALNNAIQEMKKKGLIGQWINFIHIGI